MSRLLFGFFFWFAFLDAFGQKYHSKVIDSSQRIDQKKVKGYESSFEGFNRKSIRREWWRYAKQFGRPLNMKQYYMITIPASLSEANADVILYSNTWESQGNHYFFLGVEQESLSAQAKSLLIDFKKSIYIKRIVQKMEEKNKEAQAVSKRYRSSSSTKERKRLLNQLIGIRKHVNTLKEEIKHIENG